MKLIFKIINNPVCGMPSEKCKVFSSNLATIGRSNNSDWVLPDPERFISSKHAEVLLRNNQFYLRDVSSNGIINGHTDEAIGNNHELVILDGQTFLIGDYLIQAELESISDHGHHQQPKSEASEHADWDNQMDDFWGNSSDPLDLLAPNRISAEVNAAIESTPSLANSLERTPAFKQAMNFSANNSPEPELPPTEETSTGIPENWDNTSFSFPEPKVEPQPSVTAIQQPIETAIPAAINELNDIATDDDFFLGLAEDSFFTEHKAEAPSPSMLERPASTRPRKRQNNEKIDEPRTKNNYNLLAVARLEFENQGFDKELLTEEVATQWLSLMPTVMQSTIELLQARAAIKNEFRVSKTLLTTSENNPLKFSANAEDAINSLFHQKRPGFMKGELAFKQAFRDINQHQSALLHGVRVAMMDLLKQFDADALEDSFTKSNKSTGILDKFNSTKSSQAKLWQQYKELYKSEYKVDSDDSFQRIFGETFAQAYDEFSTND